MRWAIPRRLLYSHSARPPPISSSGGTSQSSMVCALEARLQQHELAIARDQEIDHLRVAVTGRDALAHQKAQVARQRRLGIVDRLVLADHAAQFA